MNALGFIEVYGLVAGIEAADAMLKSAQVRLLRQYEVRPGLITVVVEGDLAACRAAVAAGVAAASRVGTVIAENVIGRPDQDTETLIMTLIPRPAAGKGTIPAPLAPAQTAEAAEEVIAFIARAVVRGRSWREIAKRFPGHAPLLRKELDAHVESGRLNKVGARYRKPE